MIFERVRDLLSRQLEISIDLIQPETNIVDDLGADSLDLVELLSSLEEEFDIIITDERANELRTVQQVVDFIEKLV